MGVWAKKTIVGVDLPPGGIPVIQEWPCGVFDLWGSTDPTHDGWTELRRDCNHLIPSVGQGFPYATLSYKGMDGGDTLAQDERLPFRKIFLPSGDPEEVMSVLDVSDVNEGVLPANICAKVRLYQNGIKLVCEVFDFDRGAMTITIQSGWVLPGATYELLFDAPVEEVLVGES